MGRLFPNSGKKVISLCKPNFSRQKITMAGKHRQWPSSTRVLHFFSRDFRIEYFNFNQLERRRNYALQDVLTAFKQPENSLKLNEAKDNAGNDMLRMMQVVFPLATQIQMGVIEKYGFPGDGDGIIRFTQAVKMYEKQDQEVTLLNRELKTFLIPSMDIIPPENVS